MSTGARGAAGQSELSRFSPDERELLLGVQYVGPSVIGRLEEIGIADLPALARADAHEICAAISAMLGSTCWANSPQARAAIDGAIKAAQGMEA